MAKFRVMRDHEGDRYYKEGETREGSAADFEHLIPNVLQPIGRDDASNSKAVTGAPNNKAVRPAANKVGRTVTRSAAKKSKK